MKVTITGTEAQWNIELTAEGKFEEGILHMMAECGMWQAVRTERGNYHLDYCRAKHVLLEGRKNWVVEEKS